MFDSNVVDIPERTSDLVASACDLLVEPTSTLPVAVRITDMLGEEVLVVEDRLAEWVDGRTRHS